MQEVLTVTGSPVTAAWAVVPVAIMSAVGKMVICAANGVPNPILVISPGLGDVPVTGALFSVWALLKGLARFTVTSTDTLHEVTPAPINPLVTVTTLPPAGALTLVVPPQVFCRLGAAAIVIPAGSESVSDQPGFSAFSGVLVTMKFSVVVPPLGICVAV